VTECERRSLLQAGDKPAAQRPTAALCDLSASHRTTTEDEASVMTVFPCKPPVRNINALVHSLHSTDSFQSQISL